MAGGNAIQILRGTSSSMLSHKDEILLEGQPLYITDQNLMLIGQGTTINQALQNYGFLNANHALSADVASNSNYATNANYSTYTHRFDISSVGDSTLPVYISGGVPTSCSDTLGVNISGSAAKLNHTLAVNVGGNRKTWNGSNNPADWWIGAPNNQPSIPSVAIYNNSSATMQWINAPYSIVPSYLRYNGSNDPNFSLISCDFKYLHCVSIDGRFGSSSGTTSTTGEIWLQFYFVNNDSAEYTRWEGTGGLSVELTTVFRREQLIPCSGLAIKGNASSSYIPSDRMHIQRMYWSRSGNDTTLKLWGIGTDYGLTIASSYGHIADGAAVFDVVFPLGF